MFDTFLHVRHLIGVPYHHELTEKKRESTDLEEYDFIVSKNIIKLRVDAKIFKFEKSKNPKIFTFS